MEIPYTMASLRGLPTVNIMTPMSLAELNLYANETNLIARESPR